MRAKPRQISAKQIKLVQMVDKNYDCLSSVLCAQVDLLASEEDFELRDSMKENIAQLLGMYKSVSNIIIDAEPMIDFGN